LSAVRREAIRLALHRSNEDPQLAEPAFDVFFAERNRVTLYEDALLALEFLAQRFPVVALSNGNADVKRIGLGKYFSASISAQEFGIGKPDARIFHAAAGAVDVSVQSILHVGDDATLDVLGALNAGMQAAWLNRPGERWPHDLEPHITVANLTELCDHLDLIEAVVA
jgi:FMN hydrolase / 5-amino-6-(5-phospho-D-ribitylamino)uracil phosphatase